MVFMIRAIVIACVCSLSIPAHAGLWDVVNQTTSKINEANQKTNQVKQAKQQVDSMASSLPKSGTSSKSVTAETNGSSGNFELTPTSNPIKGEWGTQVTCAGPNSATCQNGMDNIVNCTHQSKGYFYRLIVAKLNERLQTDKELTQEDLGMLKADIASVTAAIKTDTVIDPDPNEPQRYLSWLNEEEQQDIQKTNLKYIDEVRKDCDNRFGGMARYSK